MRHLHAAHVDVADQDGAIVRFVRVPPECFELIGEVAETTLGDALQDAAGRPVIGVRQQRDLDAFARPSLVGGLHEHPQARRRVGLLVQELDHRVGVTLLPQFERRVDQGIAVLEVPVEAPFGGSQPRRDRFHRDGFDPTPGDRSESGVGPILSREAPPCPFAHLHTLPYSVPYGNVWKRREGPELGHHSARATTPQRFLHAAAIAFAIGFSVHAFDHARRGLTSAPTRVIVLGTLQGICAVVAVWMVLSGRGRAPMAAILVGFGSALLFTNGHLLPISPDSYVSDAHPSVTWFSWVTAFAEITTGVVFGIAGLRSRERSAPEPVSRAA